MELALLGDLAFNGLIREQPEKNHKRFQVIVPILNSADLVFGNLEMPIKVDNSVNEHKAFIHYSLLEPTKDLLKLLNVGCVSLANNHIYDCKMPGLRATINMLDQLAIYHTGAGWSPEHVEPVIIDTIDCKIAFLAYVDKSTNPGTENSSELLINYFDIKRVISDIERVRNDVDRIIISIHWGNDYSNFYTQNQRDLGIKMIHSGADIIMGHHPHTLQTYETYNGRLIFYSLGQVCFGDMKWEGNLRALKKKTKLGVIAKITMDKSCLSHSFTPTLEKKDNYLTIPIFDLEKKFNFLKYINKKIHAHRGLEYMILLKETVLDRFYEYFFGYYRNFTEQLLGLLMNLKKIRFIIRDFKDSRNN